MTTLAEFKTKVIDILGDDVVTEDDEGQPVDVVYSTDFSAQLLLSATEAALIRISSRVWKPAVLELSEETNVFDLPAKLLDVEAVFDNELHKFLPKLQFTIDSTPAGIAAGNAWHTYPSGKITFVNNLGTDGAIVYYSSVWDFPVDETDELEAPEYTLIALTLYAASYCLMRSASESATYTVFKTRVDSGDPLDIPAKEMSSYFLKRFEINLASLPMTEKAVR